MCCVDDFDGVNVVYREALDLRGAHFSMTFFPFSAPEFRIFEGKESTFLRNAEFLKGMKAHF